VSEPLVSDTVCAFVLDDEKQVGALICKVLAACGFAPRQFTSPADFLAELAASPPELVLLDLSLGQSDAIEVIRNLENVKYQGSVLLVSGRDEATLNDITEIGKRHGLLMLPPLKKPFRPADLKLRLSGAGASGAEPKPILQPDSNLPAKIMVELGDALRNKWLELWYQPKINLKSSAICGAEALIRARHPVHGTVLPSNLLPPAGDPGYEPLTNFVIERAMADWCRFAEQGVVVKLSINVPVSMIRAPDFVSLVRSSLPNNKEFCGLTIEVTEDELIRDCELTREVATQLKLYNVDISIDDFGSGYASLSRLNDLPFAELKIDRRFVDGCASNPLKHGLCHSVVDLAHRFGATVCAEGVESAQDLRALIAMNCDQAQGFLFARPMSAVRFASDTLLRATTGSLRQHLSKAVRRQAPGRG
jgi:EAL domain-containing protein (putative c-di-GMP-specific phosphodiesterase class I)